MQKILFSRIEFWIVLLLFVIGLFGMVGFGYAVLDAERENGRFGRVSDAALAIAEIPDTIKTLSKGTRVMTAFAPDRFGDKPSGWTFMEGAPRPDGYVLLSRYNGDKRRHVVELVDLSDGSIKHSWEPNADTLLAGTPRDSRIASYPNWTTPYYRVIHPYLSESGQLITKDHQSYLYALDSCSQEIWGQETALMHHSTESDGEGGYWVPSYIDPTRLERVEPDFVEDALAHIGPDGEILYTKSLAWMFIQHGLEYALFTAGSYQKDPIHLNDIQPVLKDGPYWKKGDLFLSFRHQSMIMLYRPSTDEIIWQRQGPWLAQHDVDILDDTRIAVFNNRAYDKGTGARVYGTNQITVYDFATDSITQPWAAAMERSDVKTLFEGLFTVLPENGLMVEEENSGRLLFVTKTGETMAEFVNTAADGRAYRLGWSRYMTREDGDRALGNLGACGT
ncbi:MAG: arylsulfotransferase family protein [Albidovulum sp.]